MKALIIHQHGLQIRTRNNSYQNYKSSNYNFYETIILEKNFIVLNVEDIV